MTKFIFRLLFIGLGLFVVYFFGADMTKTVWYRLSGERVEGRISGFLAGRNNPSVQPESTGVRKGKTRNRRPVFRYPVAVGATDSLEGRSNSAPLFSFNNYKLNERVPVVFAKGKPEEAYLFSFKLLFMDLFLVLFGLFIFYMGFTGRG